MWAQWTHPNTWVHHSSNNTQMVILLASGNEKAKYKMTQQWITLHPPAYLTNELQQKNILKNNNKSPQT